MDKLLKEAAAAAMNRLAEHAFVVGLPNTDEFTFRSFFIYELKQLLPAAQCESEWKRVDLLVRNDDKNVIIEFKYYMHRRSMRLDGSPANWKGGPGPKNEGEFAACVDQLHRCTFHPVAAKYLILVYERTNPRNSRHCFTGSYGSLVADGPIVQVKAVRHKLDGSVACKLLRIS